MTRPVRGGTAGHRGRGWRSWSSCSVRRPSAPARAKSSTLPDLVETITGSLAGRTEFAAQLLGSDTVMNVMNADDAFPMASTYKVAIPPKVLAMVDEGKAGLDQMIEIRPEIYVRSPVIADYLNHPGVTLSVANLIEVMIVHSDNTATDALMSLPAAPPP